MKCIVKLDDNDFNIKKEKFKNPRVRFASRGIIINDEGKIAILNKRKKNEYKLIGGGIEAYEDKEKAFLREAREETGFEIEIDDFLGTTIELKSHDNFIQKSFIYVAHPVKDMEHLELTKQEIAEDSTLLWLDIDDALLKIKDAENNLKPSKYDGKLSVYHTKYIVRRDYQILKYFKQKS